MPVSGQERGCLERFRAELTSFDAFGAKTRIEAFPDEAIELPLYVNEYWTARQRAAHSLHELSYRACFKPQLPAFFIDRLSAPGDRVYDPFMGRGTTPLEAALRGRVPLGCDINPLSRILLEPRLQPPTLAEVETRLAAIPSLTQPPGYREDLLTFYHPETLTELCALRAYLLEREAQAKLDATDAWIRMVASNRLTGHSPGFFSVYTLPPNQAVSIASQQRINERRQQVPPQRSVRELILKKSRSLLRSLDTNTREQLQALHDAGQLLTGSAAASPTIADQSVQLVVTSPPFLDVVNYQQDNWLRCWFNGLDADQIAIWQLRREEEWVEAMTAVFRELSRILTPDGLIAFEVGEVRKGAILMETLVVPAARAAGLEPELVLIHEQDFTKTANCWGIDNQKLGTNTNRIILIRRK